MRTALRTAVATALLTGLALTPVVATATAFAADGPAATAESTGTLVRTETLADGTVVKVYKLGKAWFRAEGFVRGESIGAIEANGRPAAGNDNGRFMVLTEDGRIFSWQGNYAQPTRSGTYRLADGTLVQLDRQDTRTGIQLIDRGKGLGYTYVTPGEIRRVFYMAKSAVVVMEADGGLSAYIAGGAKQATPEYLGPGIVTPKPTPTPTPAPKPAPPAKVLSGPTSLGPCTVTEVIESGYGGGWTVVLTNDLEKGPKAVLKDAKGKVLQSVDRAHPGPTGLGMKIDRPRTSTARFGQHTNGGDTAPYQWNDFPKLPKDCGRKPASTATPAPATGTGTGTGTQGGQTTVVPKGGVAAGAETGTVEQGNDTALTAAGAGAALVVAGLGLATLRRRAAARG
ncbi:hypothetical protein [Streptomyces showdoensis]|uniref:hypothetical protein n=1 Tax=Streptomyces showdoensis TaxID=68268 RepID=UPI000F4E141D|nr:hypothetical protein [Streptomyces showdoensis]